MCADGYSMKFFHRIRKGLLKENRFTRYLIYAAGEIILVVIGILIALQINNWNTNQREQREANDILLTIREGLNSDLENVISYNIGQCDQRIYVTSHLMNSKSTVTELPDSVLRNFFILGMNREFSPVTTGFEILESKGLDLLTNEVLKFNLMNLYTTEYQRIHTFLDNESANLRDVYRPELRKHFVIYPPSVVPRFQPVDLEKMLNDRDFRNAATVMYVNNVQIRDLLYALQRNVEELIADIDLELSGN